MTIRVLLADDQTTVRAGFRMLIDSTEDMHVVAEAANGTQAVELARATVPDVALMDIRMPGMDGIEATRRITSDPTLPNVHVLILTTFQHDEYIFGALRAGAGGFLLKDTDPDDLLEAIRVVASGEALLGRGLTSRVIKELVAQPQQPEPGGKDLEVLSEREREVLLQIAYGLTNEEIAAKLHLSPATAKTYVHRIMTKLHARDRVQLVIFAYDQGLVRPRP
ncbi:response regulator transcription factor [Actinoallomurus sp. NPDC052274]|uniref:response regulator transcription factor n=1 Tax=Actinoallomurus sp. NPDC052274 TaxID=3155420 RepID=UPI00343CFE74